MKRWWVSWEQQGEDYRPVGWTDSIKSYWCTGIGYKFSNLCAVVDAPTKHAVWDHISKAWPDHGDKRFIYEKPIDWEPGERLPPRTII